MEEQDISDEDDVILFFWGNSKDASMERHAQKEQERTKYFGDWKAERRAGRRITTMMTSCVPEV